jgi:hypothetical protein
MNEPRAHSRRAATTVGETRPGVPSRTGAVARFMPLSPCSPRPTATHGCNTRADFAGSTGLIFGTPKAEGTYTFTIQVKDETSATDTEAFSITIQPAPPIVVTTATLSNGRSASSTAAATCRWGPGLHLVGGVRRASPGLELPKGENTISGTQSTTGTFTFTVQVTDERARPLKRCSRSRTAERQRHSSERRRRHPEHPQLLPDTAGVAATLR